MPPKVKYTREQILQAAVELTRERGFDAVTARDVGARLGTSAKPVYTAFTGMNELKAAVIDAGDWRNRGEDFDLGFVFLPKRIGKGLLQAILIFGSTAWEVKSGQREIVLAELADKQ